MKDFVWVAFHALGLTASYGFGYYFEYWLLFFALEIAGLLFRFPFTWTVRPFLAGAKGGLGGFLRLVLVALWAVALLVGWYEHAPLPATLKGIVGVIFTLWIIDHMYAGLKKEKV